MSSEEGAPRGEGPWRRYMGLGVQMISTLGFFLLLGQWLDGRFRPGETPWCTVGLASFGILSILVWVVVRFSR